eukprot:GFKZ01010455.1.p1 GENE.GFKZ01010455.1~~GFKZ01010455.1.p1  ORF type:complete len:546 (-),score=104.73 GFKZ01010455.1:1080-2717(-)
MGKLKPPPKNGPLPPVKGSAKDQPSPSNIPPPGPGVSNAASPSNKRLDTKRLNWNLISNVRIQKTLYAKPEFQEILTLEEESEKALIDLFSNRPPPKTAVEGPSNPPREDGPKAAGILDSKRTMNTLIMLRKIKLPPKEIAQAVRTLDPLSEKLSKDNVLALYAAQFKPEEIEMAKAYAAPEEEIEKLNHAEALAVYVSRVPRWGGKIKTMVTMRTADEAEGEIRTALTNVIKASREVTASKRFEKVLATILTVGNVLNQGTTKGSAKGFRLEGLKKLAETKARERGMTLLHFVTQMLESQKNDALSLSEDMPHVQDAKKLSKQDIAQELKTFVRAVSMMGQEITKMITEEELKVGDGNGSLPSTPPPPKTSRRNSNTSDSLGPSLSSAISGRAPDQLGSGDAATSDESGEEEKPKAAESPFAVARRIFSKAEDAATELQRLHEEMLRAFSEMATLVGEDPKSAKIEDVFSTLNDFIRMFEKSIEENKEREKTKARKERLEKARAEEEEKRKKKSDRGEQNSSSATSPLAVTENSDIGLKQVGES